MGEDLNWGKIVELPVFASILSDQTKMVINDAKVKLLEYHLGLDFSCLDKILLELQPPPPMVLLANRPLPQLMTLPLTIRPLREE